MITKTQFVYTYKMMIVFSLFSGVMSFAIQFLEGFELLGFLLAVTGMGGLFGGERGKEASGPRLMEKSFKLAFEWLIMILMLAFTFLVFSNIFHIFVGANDFINAHWPGLMLSVVCIVLASSGLRKLNQPQSV